ncbi:unnamed protein product [Euphydryas editha]|uniref:Uncharacterized protein n=1 Tax=Euphydryas editha TaxID=104508 RepID=A0AAU9VEG1_EUPED|nr:unnamed protein product [Euphydryas editha]
MSRPHSSGRFWKRRRCEADDGASDVDNDDAPNKIFTTRRGRGRPPTTGKYVGLAKAKAENLAQCQRELELEAEKEAVAITRQVRAKKAFNESAETIGEVLGVLYQRTATDEIRQLQEANDLLRQETPSLVRRFLNCGRAWLK